MQICLKLSHTNNTQIAFFRMDTFGKMLCFEIGAQPIFKHTCIIWAFALQTAPQIISVSSYFNEYILNTYLIILGNKKILRL